MLLSLDREMASNIKDLNFVTMLFVAARINITKLV